METQEYEKDLAALRGLNVLALGDSLFSGSSKWVDGTKIEENFVTEYQWVNLMGVRCGWNLTNLGVGGMTVSDTVNNRRSDNGHGNKQSMWERIEKYGATTFRWGSEKAPDYQFTVGKPSGRAEDVQLILLEGGCNDYGPAIEAPLGTLESTDPGTYLGAWNRVTEYLLKEYPNAKLLFITTWELGDQPRPNDPVSSIYYSHSIVRLYNAKYADNKRIGIIDAGNKTISGIDIRNTEWRKEYSYDGYHLSNKGMELMMKNMLPLIRKFYTENKNTLAE